MLGNARLGRMALFPVHHETRAVFVEEAAEGRAVQEDLEGGIDETRIAGIVQTGCPLVPRARGSALAPLAPFRFHSRCILLTCFFSQLPALHILVTLVTPDLQGHDIYR